jgi:hypothetical protein
MKLLDYTVEILVAIVAIFFLWGIGYMILTTDEQTREFKKQCIESGMQYISGSCVK